jgi:two-component system LytT family sensor kinase
MWAWILRLIMWTVLFFIVSTTFSILAPKTPIAFTLLFPIYIFYIIYYYLNRLWLRYTIRKFKIFLYFRGIVLSIFIISFLFTVFFKSLNILMNTELIYGINAVILVFISLLSFQSTIMKDWFAGVAIEDKLMQTENKFLKTQLNPHLFKNMLNNIYSLVALKNDYALEVIVKLQNFMEYMLYDSNDKRVPLVKEVDYIKDLIDIEKLRLRQDFDFKFEIVGDLENKYIAPLLLLPFVENVFKHADLQSENSFINIFLKVKNDELQFIVKNKVVAYKNNSNSKKGGVGIENLKKRLKIIYPSFLSNTIDCRTSGSTFIAELVLYDLRKPN